MTEHTDANKAVVQRFARNAFDRTTKQWNLDVIVEVFDVDRCFSHTWGAGLAETGRGAWRSTTPDSNRSS